MVSHDARAVANEFLKRARRDGLALTNMQLQKLPYIAHGWSWALLKRGLIKELPEAWPYGPVYPSLYRSLRQYGAGAVEDMINDNEGAIVMAPFSKEEESLLDAVWNIYRKYTAYQLSEMTHRDGTPWTLVRRSDGGHATISDVLTKAHYEKLLRDRKGNTAQ